jgi:hypothetical protein
MNLNAKPSFINLFYWTNQECNQFNHSDIPHKLLHLNLYNKFVCQLQDKVLKSHKLHFLLLITLQVLLKLDQLNNQLNHRIHKYKLHSHLYNPEI